MKKVMPFLLGLCLILSSFMTCPVLADDSQTTENTAESEEESTQEIQETESSIEIISDIPTEDSSSEESVFDEENEEESSVEEEPAEEESIPQEQQEEISEEEMQPETTEEESEILPEEPSEEESEEEVSEETEASSEEETPEEETSQEENPEEEDSEEEEEPEEESEEEDSGKTVYSPSDWLKDLLNNPVIERMAVQGRTYESEINNFPADYKALLEQMHASHPNWVFVADYNGIDFATAVQAEASGDRSQIPVLCSDLIKSNTGNNYYPEYGTYRIVDGSGNNGWVNANEAIITYFMDPRNFLNDKYIWQFETYSYDAGTQKESTVRQIWPGPTFDGVSYTTFTVDNNGTEEEVSYSYVITQAGKTTGVSPVWLASKIRQEVGLGSGSITGTYTTDTGIKYNGVVDLDGYIGVKSDSYTECIYSLDRSVDD